jgi:hypothetical protein
MPSRAQWTLLSCLFVSGSCAPERTPALPPLGELPSPRLPEREFQRIGTLTLEESATVVNVAPVVSADTNGGGFFIVDQREARVRTYRPDGSLARQFGRRGPGPGEFQRPMSGYRLASGGSIVADPISGLLRFDGRDSLVLAQHPRFTPIYSVVPLSDSLVLLAGRSRGVTHPGSPLLHVWDLTSGRVVRSFFPTPGTELVQQAARNFGWVGVALRGDTVAAVFALTDTVYFFRTDGRPIGKHHLPISGFTPMQRLPVSELGDPVRRTRWMHQFYFLYDLFWLPDGSILVQYERPHGLESAWNLVHLSRNGRRLFDLKNTPKLMAERNGKLYFVDPGAEVPNQWLVTRLKP